MKNILSKYFVESYVGNHSLKYNSGVHLNIDDCCPNGISEIDVAIAEPIIASNSGLHSSSTDITMLLRVTSLR